MSISFQRVGEYILLQLLAIGVVAVGLVFLVTLAPVWPHLLLPSWPSVGALVFLWAGWRLVGHLIHRNWDKFRGKPTVGRLASARHWLFLTLFILAPMTLATIVTNRPLFHKWFPTP